MVATRNDTRANLITAVLKTRLALVDAGIVDAESIKRRDKREPGRKRKEEAEQRLIAALMRYWRGQARRIRTILERYAPERKIYVPTFVFDAVYTDNEAEAGLLMILMNAAKDGVDLVSAMFTIGLDYTLINTEAAAWARTYGYELIKGINETTKQALQSAISSFVETPGFTIRDTMNMLPFNEDRAAMIATTEITNVYSQANQMAGEELAKEYPDVKVVKTFYTNNDDRVCFLCGPLDGQTVDIDKSFIHPETKAEFMNPAIHPRCRCFTRTSTMLADLGEETNG